MGVQLRLYSCDCTGRTLLVGRVRAKSPCEHHSLRIRHKSTCNMYITQRKLASLACLLLLCFSTLFTTALAQDAPAEAVETSDATAEGPSGEAVTEREAELLERLPDMTLKEEGILANNTVLRVMCYTAVAAMAFLVPVLIVHLIGKFFYSKVASTKGVPAGLQKTHELEKKLNAAASENEQLKSLLPNAV